MAPHYSPCARFGSVTGVIRCRVGFAGGKAPNPSYEDSEHQHQILQSNREIYKTLEKRLLPSQLAHSHLACRLEGYIAGYDKPENFDKEVPDLYIPQDVVELVRASCVENQIPEPGSDRMNDWDTIA
ncbi:unnamed protein product [Orchesella dallaii]|uniref:Uncharacterized protein n=1 Tax=Orchesella dallaii TaxID=48710 RepID=A0ABP1S4E2_9HEXA